MTNRVKDAHGKNFQAIHIAPYAALIPCYAPVSKNKLRITGSTNGCREEFCAEYRRQFDRSSNKAYAVILTGMNKKSAEKLLEKMDNNLSLVNELEEEMRFERTTAQVYYAGKSLDYTNSTYTKQLQKMKTVPMVIVLKVDEIWMSSPALLSLHSLLMRVNHKVRGNRKIKSFTKLKELNTEVPSNDSIRYRDIDNWYILLDNLIRIYPANRSYRENWFYPNYANADGISGFCSVGNWAGGDSAAKTAFRRIRADKEKKAAEAAAVAK